MRSLFSVVVLLLVAAASALSTTGSRLLVVLDELTDKEAYHYFLGDIEARGFDITYETPKSEGLKLFHLGERTYDHVMFLPTKVKGLGPNLTPNILVDFVNAKGNIFVAMSSTTPVPSSLVSLLSELDITLPAERTGTVVDHFNYDAASATDKHDVLVLEAPANIRAGRKKYLEMPSAYLTVPHAVGHVLGQSQLLNPVLRAPSTAYSYNPKEQGDGFEDADDLFAAGQQLSLLSVAQARNSARVTVVGSADMLTDKWFHAKVINASDGRKIRPDNREFARRLSGWAFHEVGVLRVNEIEHRLHGDNETNPEIYRIKNKVSYSISISEWSWDKWEPFVVPDQDALQLEFSMLSPFHRLDLSPTLVTESATVFGASFVLPDQHGIFNFMVNYKRPLLTTVEEKRTVSVRHMAHDEWPRSFVISGAWPWISGIAATVVGFLGFCVLWMYSKPTDRAVGVKKTQ
jgi:oligosaccharyltransferase complex subunit beta